MLSRLIQGHRLKWLLLYGFSIGVITILVRTWFFSSEHNNHHVFMKINHYHINEGRALDNLSKAIQIKTVSYKEKYRVDVQAFDVFKVFIKDTFPLVEQYLTVQTIDHSLLFKWTGKNDKASGAILLMAHMDVVPAMDDKAWVFPPFSGKIHDGYVWGRGAIDMKGQLMAYFEAIEYLLAKGFIPNKSIYIAVGHDEEIGGKEGNQKIAQYFLSNRISVSCVLDEGGFVLDHLIPNITQPVGVIGIAEKGYVTLNLSNKAMGGHSSLPSKYTAIGRIASAVAKLENHPFDTTITKPTNDFLNNIGKKMSFFPRIIFANRWLFDRFLMHQLNASNNTNALIRTTIAPTVIRGGTQDNMLPENSNVLVNFRILPGETVNMVVQKVKTIIDDDQIKIDFYGHYWEPSAVSSTHTSEYEIIKSTAESIFENILVTPYLVVGSTDSRYYSVLTPNIYKFSPIEINQDILHTMHGVNERVSTIAYIKAINFYIKLMKCLSQY